MLINSIRLDRTSLKLENITAEEKTFSNRFNCERRRLEFLLGRQQLRQQASSLLNLYYSSSILPNTQGYSRLKNHLVGSISHNETLLITACSNCYSMLGIDCLKKINLDKSEINFFKRTVDRSIINTQTGLSIFSIKEAAIKALYPTLNYKILPLDLSVRNGEISIKTMDFAEKIYYNKVETDNYIFSIVYTGDPRYVTERNRAEIEENLFQCIKSFG